MAGTTISFLGAILLLITASYDYYQTRKTRQTVNIDRSKIESKDGEIDRSNLPAIGSNREQMGNRRLVLIGYLISLFVETIGLAVFFGVV